MVESPQPRMNPRRIVHSLTQEETQTGLHEADIRFQTEIRTMFKKFDNQELQRVAGVLIQGLGKEDHTWNAPSRTAALSVVNLMPLNRVPSIRLLTLYLGVVRKQKEDADPRGTIDSLLDLGAILTPCFPQEQRTQEAIAQTWKETGARLSRQSEWKDVSKKVEKILNTIVPEETIEIPAPAVTVFSRNEERKKRKRMIENIIINGRRNDLTRREMAHQAKINVNIIDRHITRLRSEGRLPTITGKTQSTEISENDRKIIVIQFQTGKSIQEIVDETGFTFLTIRRTILLERRKMVAQGQRSIAELAELWRVKKYRIRHDRYILREQGLLQ